MKKIQTPYRYRVTHSLHRLPSNKTRFRNRIEILREIHLYALQRALCSQPAVTKPDGLGTRLQQRRRGIKSGIAMKCQQRNLRRTRGRESRLSNPLLHLVQSTTRLVLRNLSTLLKRRAPPSHRIDTGAKHWDEGGRNIG